MLRREFSLENHPVVFVPDSKFFPYTTYKVRQATDSVLSTGIFWHSEMGGLLLEMKKTQKDAGERI